MRTKEACLQELKTKGIRLTRSRKALISFLVAAHAPRAIPEIQTSFQKEGIVFHKTTLYRELEFLINEGIVKEVIVSGEKRYYELVGEHHHHTVCLSCGDIRDIVFRENLLPIEQALSQEDGFQVLEHSLEFFGLCRMCKI
ncbi:MAG: Fur family transcriptional regulator, ferric uptake regulator [Patescibacteria group bacterium]|jgi:Fe2+ or Zn2+ uptake regulation protein|nr:Fur family transcriptional regulator, ferric uptake regulator [Patescibacteria group bacterium]